MNIVDYPHSELLRVTRAYYLHWYVIEVEFNNGEVHQIDFEPLIFKAKDKSYHLLKDLDFFKSFVLDYTIFWSDELAPIPEYLYFLAHQYDDTKHDLFRSWGYM